MQKQDRILVFAEGRAAEEAKKAGADIVGGPELIDGVSIFLLGSISPFHLFVAGHQWPPPGESLPVHASTHSNHHSQIGSCIGTQGSHAI